MTKSKKSALKGSIAVRKIVSATKLHRFRVRAILKRLAAQKKIARHKARTPWTFDDAALPKVIALVKAAA